MQLSLKELNFRILPRTFFLFFSKYPIKGVKFKDFNNFCELADIMKEKGYLTEQGLKKICLIRDRMNTGRND